MKVLLVNPGWAEDEMLWGIHTALIGFAFVCTRVLIFARAHMVRETEKKEDR